MTLIGGKEKKIMNEDIKKIKKALDCRGCMDYDRETGKCKSQIPIPAVVEFDDFGKQICLAHRSLGSGRLTGGFKFVEPKPVKPKKNVWFISDLHANHLRCMFFKPGRAEVMGIDPHEEGAIEKHDRYLIDLWNRTVSKEDDVYILGDVCMGNREQTRKFVSQLHGHKFLILGNHDKGCKGNEDLFEWVGDIKEAKFTNNQFEFIDPEETFCVEMCHYPIMSWNRRPHGTCHAHGHCHNALTPINNASGELRVDVGFDSDLAEYQLISLEKLYKHFRKIVTDHGCNSFQEYIDYLMEKQQVRL